MRLTPYVEDPPQASIFLVRMSLDSAYILHLLCILIDVRGWGNNGVFFSLLLNSFTSNFSSTKQLHDLSSEIIRINLSANLTRPSSNFTGSKELKDHVMCKQ